MKGHRIGKASRCRAYVKLSAYWYMYKMNRIDGRFAKVSLQNFHYFLLMPRTKPNSSLLHISGDTGLKWLQLSKADYSSSLRMVYPLFQTLVVVSYRSCSKACLCLEGQAIVWLIGFLSILCSNFVHLTFAIIFGFVLLWGVCWN